MKQGALDKIVVESGGRVLKLPSERNIIRDTLLTPISLTCPYCWDAREKTEVHISIVSEEAIVNIIVNIDRIISPIETNLKCMEGVWKGILSRSDQGLCISL